MSTDGLGAFVASITYKPGWRFKLAGPGGRWLCVFAETVDSLAPHRLRLTQHQFEFPDPLPDRHELCRWVRDRMLDIERHEASEFLAFAGTRPFWPHHQDEGSPYEPVERWETTT